MKPLPNVTRTPFGYRISVCVAGHRSTKRFPPTTARVDLLRWRDDERRRLQRLLSPAIRGTLVSDITSYLNTIRTMPTHADRARDLAAWGTSFGHRTRYSLRAHEIQAQLHTWRETLTASTVNHRRTALAQLFAVLDRETGYNPVRAIPKFREPDPVARGLPYDVLRAIIEPMNDSVSKARLLIMAWTGLSPSTLMRLRPTDVDETKAEILVPGRRKGHGTKPQRKALLPEAVDAFRLLRRLDGWGTFSQASLRMALRRATRAYQRRSKAAGTVPHPAVAQMTPYDLRHSFGSEHYRSSKDIRATQAALGHSSIALTLRYTLAAVDERERQALRQFKASRIAHRPRRRRRA